MPRIFAKGQTNMPDGIYELIGELETSKELRASASYFTAEDFKKLVNENKRLRECLAKVEALIELLRMAQP